MGFETCGPNEAMVVSGYSSISIFYFHAFPSIVGKIFPSLEVVSLTLATPS